MNKILPLATVHPNAKIGDNVEIGPYAYVDEFVDFARRHPELTFLVTEVGCGIAGFTPAQIAPLFADAVGVENIHLPQRFWDVLKAK